jgi:hypothetical protein
MVFFSVIISYYQGVQSDEVAQRLLDSLKKQSFNDFEVLFVHDGPLLKPLKLDFEGLDFKLYTTMVRENVWGHNARDLGVKKSRGLYLLIGNADNVYYDCLGDLHSFILEEGREFYTGKVKMMGMKDNVGYDNPRNYNIFHVLEGEVKFCGIDMMQLIIKGDILRPIGWWNRCEQSDGIVAVALANKFGYKKTGVMMGEHY